MSITSKDFLDLLYNRKLPQIYRDEDKKIGYPLKRYLESLIVGGFCGSISDIEGVMLLIDPESIPEKFFPYLYESFGLEYYPDIDVSYQRKFLMNIGEFIRRRGTFAGVQFLVKVLTNLEAELSLEDNTLYIVLLAKNINQVDSIEMSMKVIENFIKTQIPYFISTDISSRIDTQVIASKSYSQSVVGYFPQYAISSAIPPVVDAIVKNELLVLEKATGGVVVPEVKNNLLVWSDAEAVILEDGAVTFVTNK